MPPKKNIEKSPSQSVKININLAEKKKNKKSRGKKRIKKLPGPLGISPVGMTRPQLPYQTQPQYIPIYLNQYPNYIGTGLPNYMNSGSPSIPLLTNAPASSPSIPALTNMTTNTQFNMPKKNELIENGVAKITQFEEVGGKEFPIGKQLNGEPYFNEEFQEINFPRVKITGPRLQPNPNATWNEEDDEDEGFFDVVGEPPRLEQLRFM